MDNWLNTEEMSDLYDISPDALGIFAWKNPNSEYAKKADGRNYFNETKLLEIQKNRVSIWNACHEYYYKLTLNEKMTDIAQIRLIIEKYDVGTISSWHAFLSSGMFSRVDNISITQLQTSTYLEIYNKWAKQYIRSIEEKITNEIIDFDIKFLPVMAEVMSDTKKMIKHEIKELKKITNFKEMVA